MMGLYESHILPIFRRPRPRSEARCPGRGRRVPLRPWAKLGYQVPYGWGYIYIGIVGIIPYILYTVKKIHCTDTLYICIYYGDISNVYTCLYSITCIYVYSIYVRFIDVWSMTDI